MRGKRIVWALSLLLGAAACKTIGGDAPFEPPPYWAPENYLDVEGVRICYLEAGKEHADAIVFVHGWSGNVQNFWDEFEHFKRTHHVLVIDAPGMGKSQRGPHVDMSAEAYVRTIVEVMDHAGIERADFVANSVGGNIATKLTIAHPERVKRLVLSNPTGSGRNGKVGFVLGTVSPRALFAGGLTTWLNYPNPDHKSVERQRFLDSFRETVEEKPYFRALADSLKSGYGKISKEALAGIEIPVMLIYTTDDPVVPPRAMDYFEEHIPDIRRHTVYKGGHVPMMRTPGEFNCVTETFLKDPKASTEPCLPDAAERARRDAADHAKQRTSERHPPVPPPEEPAVP